MLFGIIPLKAWWLAIADALMFAYDVFTGIFPSNLLPVVAVVINSFKLNTFVKN